MLGPDRSFRQRTARTVPSRSSFDSTSVAAMLTEDDIVTRKEWGARPPRRRHNIPTPTRDLVEHHTVGDYRGAAGIRAIQDFHMDGRGWSDIAYSFVVDRRTLKVYEGRGFGIAGGHTKGHNTTSHAICVTGNFDLYQPTDALLRRIAELVQLGYRLSKWPDRLTGGHRDFGSTACPGKYLYLAIPRINQYAQEQEPDMQEQHIERVERAIAELGYSVVTIDRTLTEREAWAVENIVEGLNNHMARNRDLEATVVRLKAELDQCKNDTGILRKIRELFGI